MHFSNLVLVSFISHVICESNRKPLKILIYSFKAGHSHSNFIGNIADILSEEGHNVTTLIPEIVPAFEDGTKKSRVLRVPGDPGVIKFVHDLIHSESWAFIFENELKDPYAMFQHIPLLEAAFRRQCNVTLHFGNLLQTLREENFDVMIAETFDHCGIGISNVISPRSLITVASTNIFDRLSYQIGQPILPAHIPASYGGPLDPHSIISRVKNLIALASSLRFTDGVARPTEELFKSIYGSSFPDFSEIIGNSSLTLVNSDPFLDFAKPMLRKVIEIGGIAVREVQPLEKKWDIILSLRQRTVLVSFGTVSRAFLMSKVQKEALAEAFTRFPNTTFIWKYEMPTEKDFFAKDVDNLILTEWMPQNDLLADDRVDGFLTHAGKGSFFEAAVRGKATLLVPLFGDQFRNAATLEHLGFGHSFSKTDLNDVEKLEQAIRTILEDVGIHERAREIKEIMRSRPFSPRELLVKNVEFVGKFGAQKSFQPRLDLNYIVYYNIDLIFGALILGLIIVFITVKLVISVSYRLLYSIVRRERKIKQN